MLKTCDKESEHFEDVFKGFRMCTMAMAEEEEVIKFYFYSKYKGLANPELILIEVVIDRVERTIDFLFKHDNEALFDFWSLKLFDFLKQDNLIE